MGEVLGMFSASKGADGAGGESSKKEGGNSKGRPSETTFQLRPNKTRTGGKKKSFLSSCSVL